MGCGLGRGMSGGFSLKVEPHLRGSIPGKSSPDHTQRVESVVRMLKIENHRPAVVASLSDQAANASMYVYVLCAIVDLSCICCPWKTLACLASHCARC